MSIKLTINKYEIFIILLLFAAMEIDSFPYIMPSTLASAFNRWLPAGVCIFMAILLVIRRNVSPIFLAIIAYFALLIIITVFKNYSATYSCILQILSPLALCMMAEYFMKNNSDAFLRAALFLLMILLLIDLFTIFAYPNGLYSSDLYTINWFLGYKTSRVRLVTMPVIMMAAIISVKKNNKLNLMFWIVSILAFIDTLMSEATGGAVTIIIMLILLSIIYLLKNERRRAIALKFFNFKILIPAVLVLTLVVNVFQNVRVFAFIIENILDRGSTFYARMRIWNASLNLINSFPIFGSGYITNSEFVLLAGDRFATQPHSLFLSIIVYTGILGLVLFLVLLIRVFSYVGREKKESLSMICAIYILCVMIHGIASIMLFAQFFYVSMIMLYYLRDENAFDSYLNYDQTYQRHRRIKIVMRNRK